jgi:acyl carrier protein
MFKCLSHLLEPGAHNLPPCVVLYDHWHTASESTMRVPPSWISSDLKNHAESKYRKDIDKITHSQKIMPSSQTFSGSSSSIRKVSSKSQIVLDLLIKVSSILSMESSVIESSVPLSMYGLDSLAAVELVNHIQTEYGIKATDINLLAEDHSLASLSSVIENLMSSKTPQSYAGTVESVNRPSIQQTSTAIEPSRIEALLLNKISTILSIETSVIDSTVPLSMYGLDSLAAVELINYVQTEFDMKSMNILAEDYSLEKLTADICKSVQKTSAIQNTSAIHDPIPFTTTKVQKEDSNATMITANPTTPNQDIIVKESEAMVEIIINRPEFDNSITEAMLDEMLEAIKIKKGAFYFLL